MNKKLFRLRLLAKFGFFPMDKLTHWANAFHYFLNIIFNCFSEEDKNITNELILNYWNENRVDNYKGKCERKNRIINSVAKSPKKNSIDKGLFFAVAIEGSEDDKKMRNSVIVFIAAICSIFYREKSPFLRVFYFIWMENFVFIVPITLKSTYIAG